MNNPDQYAMTTELRWLASQSASCFYATELLDHGCRLTDRDLAAAIEGPSDRLRAEVEGSGVPPHRFWRHLVPLSVGVEDSRQLAETALRKTIGNNDRVEWIAGRLAGLIKELKAAAQKALPGGIDELAARGQPLLDQWKLYGESLLKSIAIQTDERLIPANAEVVLVSPATGGGGAAYLLYNKVCLEVATGGPGPDFPEPVRLAWLLSQLNVDLPIFSENIFLDRRPLVASLAMLPAALAAAEELQLCRFDPETVRAAFSAWRIDQSGNGDLAGVVQDWWATCVESHPPWNVALAALDRMVG